MQPSSLMCKQLVLTIIRSLYDLNNKVIKQNYGSNTEDILRHHFISRSSGTYFPQIPSAPVSTFTTSGQWIEQESNTWRFSRSKVLSTIYLLIPVRKDSNVLVVASGIVKREWIFGCTRLSGTETKTCAEAENLSEKSEIIPNKGKKSQRRLINLDSKYLQEKKYPFILIYITPLDSQGFGSNFREGMDVCNCLVPLQHGGTLNSHRAASSIMRLVKGVEWWEAPDHLQGTHP
ncbi:GPI inositol-deacylase [Trichonephila clavipes]|nr:GPI inositol-deacylase [Trichonephila clavipes]